VGRGGPFWGLLRMVARLVGQGRGGLKQKGDRVVSIAAMGSSLVGTKARMRRDWDEVAWAIDNNCRRSNRLPGNRRVKGGAPKLQSMLNVGPESQQGHGQRRAMVGRRADSSRNPAWRVRSGIRGLKRSRGRESGPVGGVYDERRNWWTGRLLAGLRFLGAGVLGASSCERSGDFGGMVQGP